MYAKLPNTSHTMLSINQSICTYSQNLLLCDIASMHRVNYGFMEYNRKTHDNLVIHLYTSLCVYTVWFWFFNWSLFSLLAVLDPRLLSPYPDHLLPHLSKLQTVLFNMRHPAFGINFLILSVSLIHILVFHLLTTLHKSDPHCHHHHFHHLSLLLVFTVDLKHTSSSSLFHHRPLHRYSLDWSHGLAAWPFSLAYQFSFSFFR